MEMEGESVTASSYAVLGSSVVTDILGECSSLSSYCGQEEQQWGSPWLSSLPSSSGLVTNSYLHNYSPQFMTETSSFYQSTICLLTSFLVRPSSPPLPPPPGPPDGPGPWPQPHSICRDPGSHTEALHFPQHDRPQVLPPPPLILVQSLGHSGLPAQPLHPGRDRAPAPAR